MNALQACMQDEYVARCKMYEKWTTQNEIAS